MFPYVNNPLQFYADTDIPDVIPNLEFVRDYM